MGSYAKRHGKLDLLDLSSWTWETRKPYSTDVWNFATLVYDESMFVFGGYSSQKGPLDLIRSYNPNTDTWIGRGKLLEPHCTHDVIFSSGLFLILGDENPMIGENHKSEKCILDGNLFVCQKQKTLFGSVELVFDFFL